PELSDVPVRAPELAELRAAVHGARIDADLALGRHAELIAELSALVRENPRAERTAGQLMRALYYSGRRVDALDVYRQVARHVSDSFGIDPGPSLRALHERILNDDLPPVAPALPPAMVDVTRIVPRQLPPAPGPLAGRGAEFAWLDGLPEDGVVVLTGAAGVGKSALVVSWARQASRRFPDGALYTALRGFDPQHPPVEPADVLSQFLQGLGVPLADLPERFEERVALYRSLIEGRRMLVVLDDAASADQVRPLLPPGTMAVVTSRSRLDGLVVSHAATVRRLDPLARRDSMRLLAELAGTGTAEQHERLAALCGDLPLALRIAGARLAGAQEWRVEDYLAELAGERTRLTALDIGDVSVRAALDVSYRGLSPEAAGTFRALGVLAGRSAGPHLVAAIEEVSVPAARARLRELAAHHLLTENGPDVFTQHDLVRLYQRELATRGEHVLDRSLRYYQAVADRARRKLLRVIDPLDFTGLPVVAPALDSVDEALAWFAAEWPNLIATAAAAQDAGRHDEVWRLTRVANTYRIVRPVWDEWSRLVELGTASAEASGSAEARAWMLLARCALALTYELGERGLADAEAALGLSRELPDVRLAIAAKIHRGCALTLQGRYREAIDCLRETAEEAARAGDLGQRVQALNRRADAEKRAGDHAAAIRHQLAALEIDRRLGDDSYVVASLNNVGELHLHLGDFDEALRYAREAVELTANRGFLLQEALSRLTLARILRVRGDREGARAQLGLSVALYRRVSPRITRTMADELAALGLEHS
ncbi:tetratricopeptide repeat protein, partial [Amycolatopsis rhizosphaerae]